MPFASTALAAALTAGALVLAGCGAPAGEAASAIAAAASPGASQSAPPSSAASDREAALTYKETRVCIVNNTGRTLKPDNFDGSAAPGGGRVCWSGSGLLGEWDVNDGVSSTEKDGYTSTLLFRVAASNPSFGSPHAWFDMGEDLDYDEGQSRDFEYDFACSWGPMKVGDVTLKREKDTNYKNWTLTVHNAPWC